MIHNVDVTINLRMQGLSRKDLLKLTDKLINAQNGEISFEDLDKILILSARPYHIASIEFPDLSTEDYFIKQTKIDIIA
jgi:hypothetical protein